VVAYKVVKRVQGRLVSAAVWGEHQVEYRQGEWVRAAESYLSRRGYGLLVFLDVWKAMRWMETYSGIEVWSAEIRGEVELLPPMLYLPLLDSISIGMWPQGTGMCKEVRLVKSAMVEVRT
tara:strand:- start:2407 stop:2766 length:360 start_codon:yes stop_codon:yes gene_type:complete